MSIGYLVRNELVLYKNNLFLKARHMFIALGNFCHICRSYILNDTFKARNVTMRFKPANVCENISLTHNSCDTNCA